MRAEEYTVVCKYSEEDGCYLAEIPALPGCIADGQTKEEAIRNAYELAKECIRIAEEDAAAGINARM